MANKFDIDPDLVRKLSDLLGETGLSEIEYESAGRRIRVARNIAGTGPVVTVGGGTAQAVAAPAASDDRAEEAERQRSSIVKVQEEEATAAAATTPRLVGLR